ncbi:MAG: purine-nucleoside phosphorylase [Colwellia sp.]|jgi:purine-nucleoside phosphorylase
MKNTKRKLAIVITTLSTGLFALVSNSSMAQATELLKAEPIEQISLYQEAKESLALSFTGLTISQNINSEVKVNTMAKQQNSVNKNFSVTLTNANLISE